MAPHRPTGGIINLMPSKLQGIETLKEIRPSVHTSPSPPPLPLSCTLPVTESAALEEQVAAGDGANLT